MAAIKFPAFAPDVASVDATVASVATNVVPRADGYGPVASPTAISAPLPADCRGAIEMRSPAFGFPVYFAGTGTKLYKFNLGTASWDDVSAPGTTYGVPPGDYWSFAVYGTRLVATCLGARPQVIDIDLGKHFRNLGGNPPRARHCGVVGEFLVLAGLASDPNAVQWSDLGDIETWVLGVQNGHTGDIQLFPDGGAVTGFAGGEFGIVFQESTIRRMVFSAGSATWGAGDGAQGCDLFLRKRDGHRLLNALRRRLDATTHRQADQFGVGQLEVTDRPAIHVGARRRNRPAEGNEGFGGILASERRGGVVHTAKLAQHEMR